MLCSFFSTDLPHQKQPMAQKILENLVGARDGTFCGSQKMLACGNNHILWHV